jgi:predicted RND superfamily exporter protein
VRITGNQALNYEEMISIVRQAVLATALSFALVACILAFAIGSVRAVVHILVTLVVGLLCTSGFAAAIVGHLNMVSLTFAVLFVGLGVDFGIHLVLRYGEARREPIEAALALEHAARHVGPALLLCAVSTAIGFYAFVPTDYLAVAELGLIAGTGMFVSFALSLTLLPALLSVWPPRRALGEGRHRALGARVAALPRRYPGRVAVVAALLGAGALALVPGVRFDHDPVRLRDPSTESARAFMELLQSSDTSPWNIDVVRGDLDAANAEAERLRRLDVVERAITLADFVPSEQEEKRSILEQTAGILNLPARVAAETPIDPAERRRAVATLRDALATSEATRLGTLAESARRFELELAQVQARAEASDEVVRDMLTPGGRARIRVFPAGDLGAEGGLERFVDDVRALAPDATGSAVSLLEWRRATVRSFRNALGLALALISLLLWLRWRRVGDTLLVLVPLLLAALLTAATTVAIGMPFNFINVVVIPLLLGIGVDSGIHMVERHRAGEGGEAGSQSLLESATARAVYYSSLTTVGSFGALAFSTHRGLASMGVLLVFGLLYALAGNLLLLPALIELRQGSPR